LPNYGSIFKEANLLVIESNYDEEMLENGSYPYYYKTRIRSDHGHLEIFNIGFSGRYY